MNAAVRILEAWTTHQDYVWFLAMVAWGGVIAAELRRRDAAPRSAPPGWLLALAGSCIAGALLELVLLAQDLKVPYARLDAAMGAAQAAGAAALAWAATAGVRWPLIWRVPALTTLAALAAARVFAPVEAGAALALFQAIAVLRLVRQHPRPFSVPVAVLLVLAPIVATHGPWAYAIEQGRRTTDWSHFALLAAGITTATGGLLAAAAWRRRLRETLPDGAPDDTLRRDLRRAVIVLALWVAGGGLLAVWYGRTARRAFEENLLRRVETGVLALDQRVLLEALGPELRITSIARRRYRDGRPVDVATVPHSSQPVYAELRAQLGRLREANPDFRYLYLATWRQGQLLVLNSTPRRSDDVRHVVHHAVTPVDLERLAAKRSFLEGPVTSEGWLPQFSAKAPLLHPQSRMVLGWLVADVDATRWLTTFTQARLQTMALVGAGVGLWAVAVAYRVRREARDAAERKAAAADAADRMKSAFLAKVSHELRTPIQSVLGYGELLAHAPLAEPQRTWLASLRSHGDIMLRLVNDLIDLGALQSGAFRLEPGVVVLRSLVDDCAAALRPAAAAKGLAFSIDLDPNVPARVQADGVRVRQVLLNLLTNAVKFTPAGQVALIVRAAAPGVVAFTVTDTGPGIPAALRSRLFQPFARLDPAAGEGSGLGLALAQGICAVMGGSIELVDTPGAGATFVARLPLPACDTAAAPSPASSPAPGASFAGLRVLIAEDNTLVRELLVAFLAENGAEVTIAADGPTAVALARERTPDVLLLDIGLPGLDGIGVAEQLRRDGPRRLRIIGLSAHASSRDEARARAAGMDVFLSKPVRLAQLADSLREPQRRAAANADAPAGKFTDEKLRSRLEWQFASETPRLLSDLRVALARGDWPLVRSRAHYLKNSADIIGATVLQDACSRLAAIEDTPDPAAVRQLLEAVEAAIPPKLLLLAEAPGIENN